MMTLPQEMTVDDRIERVMAYLATRRHTPTEEREKKMVHFIFEALRSRKYVLKTELVDMIRESYPDVSRHSFRKVIMFMKKAGLIAEVPYLEDTRRKCFVATSASR